MADLINRIIARGSEGAHVHPDLIPEWEGLALVALPALIVFGICLADILRGTGGAV